MEPMPRNLRLLALFSACAICATTVRAELSAEELAKIAQNPVGNMVSVPFQYNANLNYGTEKGTLGDGEKVPDTFVSFPIP